MKSDDEDGAPAAKKAREKLVEMRAEAAAKSNDSAGGAAEADEPDAPDEGPATQPPPDSHVQATLSIPENAA